MSPLDKKKAREMYPFDLSDYGPGSIVEIKTKKDILEEFNIVQRADYYEWMD